MHDWSGLGDSGGIPAEETVDIDGETHISFSQYYPGISKHRVRYAINL